MRREKGVGIRRHSMLGCAINGGAVYDGRAAGWNRARFAEQGLHRLVRLAYHAHFRNRAGKQAETDV